MTPLTTGSAHPEGPDAEPSLPRMCVVGQADLPCSLFELEGPLGPFQVHGRSLLSPQISSWDEMLWPALGNLFHPNVTSLVEMLLCSRQRNMEKQPGDRPCTVSLERGALLGWGWGGSSVRPEHLFLPGILAMPQAWAEHRAPSEGQPSDCLAGKAGYLLAIACAPLLWTVFPTILCPIGWAKSS